MLELIQKFNKVLNFLFFQTSFLFLGYQYSSDHKPRFTQITVGNQAFDVAQFFCEVIHCFIVQHGLAIVFLSGCGNKFPRGVPTLLWGH